MADKRQFDVIIIGGSYAGLAAGMALGRSLRSVLIIDSGKPCNRQTPYSHNFITQDGKAPGEIAALAKAQVEKYDTVRFFNGVVMNGVKTEKGFDIEIASGEIFRAAKIIFATGINDIMPAIPGFAECWGVSMLHCPYCHGYEVRNQQTGILGNGDQGFALSSLISNWTNDLTLFTNGRSTLTPAQKAKLFRHNISIVEEEIGELVHDNGYLQHIVFKNGSSAPVKVLYARTPFIQSSAVPEMLECELSTDGYIKTDASQKTNVHAVFACGDNASPIRTIANAVCTGTTAGMMANKEFIEEAF